MDNNELDQVEVLQKYHNTILKLANKYSLRSSRFDFDDLVEEGRVAAINASKSFDKSKNTKFITYLTNSVSRELSKFVGDNSYDLTVTEHDRRDNYSRYGSNDKLKEKAVCNRLIYDNGDTTSSNTISHYTIPSGDVTPEDAMIWKENISILREEIEALPDRDKQVIELRFINNMTLVEVADIMNTTKQNVHFLAKKSFDKLAQRVRSRLGGELY